MAERHKILLESPQFKEENVPHLSTSPSSASYVLSIASLPSHYATAVSAPHNVIDLFDKTTLQGLRTLSGHEIATTSLHTVNNLVGMMSKCLISSGKDGSAKIWDDRSTSHSIKMTNLGKPQGLLCCDVAPDGLTVVAGTELQGEDALILYWDPRQPATPLRTHGSTHSDDITSLSYAPTRNESNQNIILSGSADGLISTSNANEDDEDEAVIQVGNWGCSVSQSGWIHAESGPMSASVWAASDMETFSTWTSELDQLLNLDIRSPVLHQKRTWVTDYLITAHSTKTAVPNLSIFTGSNEGDIALLSNMNISVPEAPWCLHKLWTHGHVGVVRSLFWDEENCTLVTGGEDSKINSWPIHPVELEADEVTDTDDTDEDESMDIDMVLPKGRKRERGSDDELQGKRARC